MTGDDLRRERVAAGVSQRVLEHRADFPAGTVSRLESGDRPITEEKAARIRAALAKGPGPSTLRGTR